VPRARAAALFHVSRGRHRLARLRLGLCARPADLSQVLVNILDRTCVFAHGGGQAFHRVQAHVADGEYAGYAGLEVQRRALQRPEREVDPSAGGDESLGVSLYNAWMRYYLVAPAKPSNPAQAKGFT
jgi:hypothetical protein